MLMGALSQPIYGAQVIMTYSGGGAYRWAPFAGLPIQLETAIKIYSKVVFILRKAEIMQWIRDIIFPLPWQPYPGCKLHALYITDRPFIPTRHSELWAPRGDLQFSIVVDKSCISQLAGKNRLFTMVLYLSSVCVPNLVISRIQV